MADFGITPMMMTMASMAATAAGAAITAQSTIAGGKAAAAAGKMQQEALNHEAAQVEENARGERAVAQIAAGEKRRQAALLGSTLRARAAAAGVDPSAGSPLATEMDIAKRGEFQALTEMWRGDNAATGLENVAAGRRYSGIGARMGGEAAERASYLSAAGTIASGAGSMLRTYGAYGYPAASGRPSRGPYPTYG